MTPWRSIFRHARSGLLVLAGTAVVCGLLIHGSEYASDTLHANLLQSRGQLNAEKTGFTEKVQDLVYIRTHNDEFRTLAQQGLMASPDRAGWVEQLLLARKERGLPDTLAYTLKPPVIVNLDATPVVASPETGTASVEMPSMHDLEFELRGIHEEELIGLLENFQTRIRQRFRVQACHLHSALPEGLSAQCTLRFFSLPQGRPDKVH